MTLDIKDFKILQKYVRGGKLIANVQLFLYKNMDKAFTTKEVAEGIKDKDIKKVGRALWRVYKRGMIECKSPYWAYKENKDLFKRNKVLGGNNES